MRRLTLLWLLTLLSALTVAVEAQTSSHVDTLVLTATRAYQTAGRGGQAVLLAGEIVVPANQDATLTTVDLTLPQATVDAVDVVDAYLTAEADNEFFAQSRAPFASSAAAHALTLTGQASLAAGTTCRLWVVAKVKDDAPVGSSLSVAVTGLSYKDAAGDVHKEQGLQVNPKGTVKVFKRQSFVFVPTTHDCRYYRIPSLIRADDNSLVAVSDMRYDNQADLGNDHRVDLVARRSTDGGLTWGEPVVIARGDGSSVARCGFGDASLAKAPSGRLICTMAAGNTNYFLGMRHFFVSTSDDNGLTWSEPKDVTRPGVLADQVSGTDGLGLWSAFPSSGRGITTRDGRVMFLLNALNVSSDHSRTYLLYTDDEGEHWTLAHDQVFGEDVASNEGKLVQRADGSIMASIRQAGKRGFNIGTPDGTRWMGETRSATLSGNDCNADILAYNDQLLLHTLIVDPTTRADLHVFASLDQGETWTDVMTIQEGGAAYSTLEVLENGDLAMIYEDASYGTNGYITNFLTIDRQTVLGWQKALGDLPQQPHRGYGAYVESRLGSFFTENVGGHFALTHEGYDKLIGTYEACVDSCSQQQFFDLQEAIFDNISYPATGYYRIRSVGARGADTYLAVGPNAAGTGDASRGYGLKTVPAADAIADASTIIRLTQVDGHLGTYRISTQGEGVVAPKSQGQPFALTAEEDEGYTFTFKPILAHAGRVTVLCDSVRSRYGFLHEASGEAGQAPVIGWTAEGTLASPSTWQVENVPSRAYRISLSQAMAPDGTSKYFGTLCVPFPVKLQQAKAYACTAVSDDEASLKEIGTAVPAGTPVVVISARRTETMAVSAMAGETVEDNILQGTCVTKAWDGAGYVLGTGNGVAGLYKTDADTLDANSAFLTGGTAPTGYAFTFADLTGVRAVTAHEGAEGVRYNVAGQRVGTDYKGIVIVDGHKLLQR